MFQVKPLHTILLLFLQVVTCANLMLAQGYDDAFEMKSKLKVELQYADYGEYEYPEPILFQYGVSNYQQVQPYIVNFPEKRALVKYVRLTDDVTAVSVKYQYSDLKEDAKQHFVEAKVTRNLSESTIGLLAGQILFDSRGYKAYQAGAGALWDFSALTSLQTDAQFFYRGPEATPVGGRMGTLNLRLKFRQVLTMSTALQTEYSFYDAKASSFKFNSHTIAIWLSQYLATETAVHLNTRYYRNTMGIEAVAPSLEIAQYLDWATVLWLKFRYYANKSSNVSLGEKEVIVPDGLKSKSFSVQVNREMNPDLLLYAKYRYYSSNLKVQMNTYLVGCVFSF